MKVLKIFVVIVFGYFCIRIAILVFQFMFGMAGVAMPEGGSSIDKINNSLHEGSNWFHEHSGMTEKEREKSMNAAGLYYNPETGRYEEDRGRLSRELDEKYGKIGE